MNINWAQIGQQVLLSGIFTLLGIILLAITFAVLNRVLPFSIRKEIEEDQNVALGVVLAAVIIGIAMIVSGALHG